MKHFLVLTTLFLVITLFGCNYPPEFNDVEVSGVSNPVISLNGTWKFSMTPPDQYWENDIDFQDWSNIQVPGE